MNDIVRKLLPNWRQEAKAHRRVHPNDDSEAVWQSLLKTQTEMFIDNVPASAHEQALDPSPLARGERGLNVTQVMGRDDGRSHARRAWSTDHGKLMIQYAQTCPEHSMIHKWHKTPGREDSKCYHAGCDRQGHPAALCDGPHNPQMTNFGEIRENLRTLGRDNGGDMLNSSRSRGNGQNNTNDQRRFGHNSRSNNRDSRNRGPRGRPRPHDRRAPNGHPSERGPNRDRRNGRNGHRDHRNGGGRDQLPHRAPRASHAAQNTCNDGPTTQDASSCLDDSGFPHQEQRSFAVISRQPAKSIETGHFSESDTRPLVRRRRRRIPRKSDTTSKKRKGAPVNAKNDKKEKRGQPQETPENAKIKVVTIECDDTPSTPFGSSRKCECGHISRRPGTMQQHRKTCAAAPDYPGKREIMIEAARKAAKKQNSMNKKRRKARSSRPKRAPAKNMDKNMENDNAITIPDDDDTKPDPPSTPPPPPTRPLTDLLIKLPVPSDFSPCSNTDDNDVFKDQYQMREEAMAELDKRLDNMSTPPACLSDPDPDDISPIDEPHANNNSENFRGQ